ncbi:MAG: hypothetical protein K8823_522 [Cenarchaeum symbiont of Oopsacas minuta]|nr:hypothetical protein [Cenarchaeum symbiont of Oopsacas minuta]
MTTMDFQMILDEYSLGDFPFGLIGCRNSDMTYECCEYDLAVFDERDELDTMVEYKGTTICIKHCSLSALRSPDMVMYDDMKIISDTSWDLHMMLSRIRENRKHLYSDYMRNSLIDSMFCITKFQEGVKISDPFAVCWIKCSTLYMVDAMLLSCMEKPSPTHALQKLRIVQKKISNDAFSLITDCIGVERTTPLLLERMAKSTAGFSDIVYGNDQSKTILEKVRYLSSESFLADCYFYLQYANRDMLIKIKNEIRKKPDLIYILKVSMDMENDITILDNYAHRLYDEANRMLAEHS